MLTGTRTPRLARACPFTAPGAIAATDRLSDDQTRPNPSTSGKAAASDRARAGINPALPRPALMQRAPYEQRRGTTSAPAPRGRRSRFAANASHTCTETQP